MEYPGVFSMTLTHHSPLTTHHSLLKEGRFGPYGGRFVPETLMYALRQLTEEYGKAIEDTEFQRQFDYYLAIRGPAVALVFCRAPDARGARRPHISQTRRPQPHRGTQDQQLHRPGPAHQTDGQAA